MGLSPVEYEILAVLHDRGDNVPKAIADRSGYHSKSVSRSLRNLSDDGLVRRKNDYGVWTLTADGREVAARLDRNTTA